jgi:hypothetical protein
MDPTQQQQHHQQQVQVKSEETTTTSSSGAAYLLHQLQVGGTTGYTVGVPPSQQQQLGVPAQQQFQLISSAPTSTQLGNFIFPGSNMTMTQTTTQTENVVPRMQQLSQQQQFNERERQIKRRTKTGCMTCRKRRIKVSPHHPKRVNDSVMRENHSVTIVKSHIENARATNRIPTQTAVLNDRNQIRLPASHHQHIPATTLPPPPTSQAPTPTRPSPPSINAVDLALHIQAGRHDSHPTTFIHGPPSNTR